MQVTAPDRERQIANRELGTIEAIGIAGATAAASRFGPDHRAERPKRHPHLDYGYAVTSHSSQGQTADRVLVHIDTDRAGEQLVNRRLAYVAVSRGRYDAQIYTNDKSQLAETLSRDVSHRSAIDFSRASNSSMERIEASLSRITSSSRPSPRASIGSADPPSLLYSSTVLVGIKGALISFGGFAALDAACAPCGRSAFSDGRLRMQVDTLKTGR